MEVIVLWFDSPIPIANQFENFEYVHTYVSLDVYLQHLYKRVVDQLLKQENTPPYRQL